jgi:mannose-6-phosphate isomerase-like protein (cupin superfamily)
MNNPLSIDLSTARHYTWGEGCDSWVLAEGENLSVKQEKMPPGAKECLHFHERAGQFFYILQGSAEFTLDESAQIIHKGQGIFVPPGTGHFIANTTDEPLEFLVISQPSMENDRVALD